MFSVRGQSGSITQAKEIAWNSIQQKLKIVKEQLSIESVRLEKVTYDYDSYVSQVEELPDEPKSARPNTLDVKVGMEAIYRIVK